MTKLGAGLRSGYAVRGTRYAVKWMTKLGAGLRSGYAVRGEVND